MKKIVIILVIVLAGFLLYSYVDNENALTEQRIEIIKESTRQQNQLRLNELVLNYTSSVNQLQIEKEKLAKAKRFKLLRLESEKRKEVQQLIEVISMLDIKINTIKKEIWQIDPQYSFNN